MRLEERDDSLKYSEYSVKCIDEHVGAFIPFYLMMIYTLYEDKVAYNEMMMHFIDLFTVCVVCTV